MNKLNYYKHSLNESKTKTLDYLQKQIEKVAKEGGNEVNLESFKDAAIKIDEMVGEGIYNVSIIRSFVNMINDIAIHEIKYNNINESVSVPVKFDKALDKLKFNEFTTDNIKKLADKHGVDINDAHEYILDMYSIIVGDTPKNTWEK